MATTTSGMCTRTTDQQIAWHAFRDYQRDIIYQGRMAEAFDHIVKLWDKSRIRIYGYRPYMHTETFREHVDNAWGMYEYLCSTVADPGLSRFMQDFNSRAG